MPVLFRTLLSSMPLVALPAVAADKTGVATGITSIGPSMFMFTIAIALLLTLVFRASVSRLRRFVAAKVGERRLRRCLATECQQVAHDLILPGAYGGLARIDHAALNRGGILCIRAVHTSGKIVGAANDAQWTCTDGQRTRRFLNPMIQNEGRVRAMRKVLPDIPVQNLVVFAGRVEFSAPPPTNVIKLDELSQYLQNQATTAADGDVPDNAWQSLHKAIMLDSASRKDFAAQISFS